MLEFRKPRLQDQALIKKRLYEGATDGTCYSFGSIITWGDVYAVEIAEYKNMLIMRGRDEGGRYYVYPSGDGDIKEAVEAMMADAEKDGEPFLLAQLLPAHMKTVKQLFPDTFDFFYDRDSAEYVYSVKNMADLPGKSFHGKKGHINAFFRKHENIHIDPITDDNIHQCLEIAAQWLADRDDENGELIHEYGAIERAVKHYKTLGFSGMILYADGKPVAFTMGEPIKNNTFCTHFEKASPDYRDAYPVINNGFTKLMLSSYEYVNREEDTGSAGLRKAKLSYNPVFLLDKYYAVPKDDPQRKFRADEGDIPALKQLWKTVFGDPDHVIDYFFDRAVKTYDIYAYKTEGMIVSAFYLIDADIVECNTRKKAKYLYAAATLPAYRNNGFMGKMIEYAAAYLGALGYDYLFLCPAEESLFRYYDKFGFKPSFKEKYYTVTKSDIDRLRSGRCFRSAVSYTALRTYIPAASFVDFSSGYLDFAAYCNSRYGRRTDVVFDDEDKVVLLGTENNGQLILDEAISANGNYAHIMEAAAVSGFDAFVLKTPYDITIPDIPCTSRFSGMALTLRESAVSDTAYLGQPCM